jgi:type II secretory pathway component PulK
MKSTRLAATQRGAFGNRPGYVIFAVLIVVVVLSLAGYRYTEAMQSEYQVAVRTSESAEAKAYAVSGIHYAAGMLSDPNTLYTTLGGNPYDNPSYFSGVTIGDTNSPRGGGRFSLMNTSDLGGSGESRYALRYGVMDESAKININALILLDPTGEVLYNALMKLPNMTEDVADAIVDWVDTDSTQRPSGAESGVYQGLPQPYLCKNGPLNSVEELLLVRGVTPQLLFGSDRNRNGLLDQGEDSSTEFSRGWSEYLTCYGRELNVDSAGAPRINLNMADLATLSQQLTPLIGQELSDYIVYQRASNKARAVAPLTSSQVAAPPEAIRGIVQALCDAQAQGTRRLSSVLTVFNTQMALTPLPAPPGPQGRPPSTPITPVLACPLNDPDTLDQVLPLLLDHCTTSANYELTPRVNVNTAPAEVLSCLPGLTPDDVAAIVGARGGLTPNDPETLSGAWLVTAAGLSPTKFRGIERYISGRSNTYRVHSVGYFGQGGPVARVEAVIDTAQGMPRIVYFRDLSELGRGFPNLPR